MAKGQAIQSFKNVKKQLDVISPSMCVAKWHQVTIHLGNGTTHSCHHPRVHTIPLDELKDNPSALHNTNYKKQLRRQMLTGERPTECDYCWRVEDTPPSEDGGELFSDRIVKSSEPWALPHLSQIQSMPWDTNVNPSYVEVDFDTTCNFKCAYCSPFYSTTWMQEIKKHGPYELPTLNFNVIDRVENEGLPILQSEYNPYIEAFWKWWPDAVRHMHTFRITGGEPLLSKNTFKVLDYLIENPQPQLEFNVNTNLGVPKEIIDKFIEKMSIIQENRCVKNFKCFTSNEAHGKKAEYIRFGLNYDYWLGNVDRILSEVPYSQVTLMSTYNLLSVTTFTDFLQDMFELKQKYVYKMKSDRGFNVPLSVDIPYLRFPPMLAAWILTENFLPYVEESVSFMYRNQQVSEWFALAGCGFYEHEIHRMERLYFLIREQMGIDKPQNIEQRRNFAAYIDEYDKRRDTNFTEVFPEYEGFYYFCRDAS